MGYCKKLESECRNLGGGGVCLGDAGKDGNCKNFIWDKPSKYSKYFALGESTYNEYRQVAVEASPWGSLTVEQQEGFIAGISHGLVVLKALPEKHIFVLCS